MYYISGKYKGLVIKKSASEMTYTEVMNESASDPHERSEELMTRLKEVDPMESALPDEMTSLVP